MNLGDQEGQIEEDAWRHVDGKKHTACNYTFFMKHRAELGESRITILLKMVLWEELRFHSLFFHCVDSAIKTFAQKRVQLAYMT